MTLIAAMQEQKSVRYKYLSKGTGLGLISTVRDFNIFNHTGIITKSTMVAKWEQSVMDAVDGNDADQLNKLLGS